MDEQSPLETYKAVIDEMVGLSPSLRARRVAMEGHYSDSPDHAEWNGFVAGLSDERRALLAGLLDEERQCAIHDVLAALDWWIVRYDINLTQRGERLPSRLGGTGLHGDYMRRLDGWNWPGTDGNDPPSFQ
jgi:hypothetical protein